MSQKVLKSDTCSFSVLTFFCASQLTYHTLIVENFYFLNPVGSFKSFWLWLYSPLPEVSAPSWFSISSTFTPFSSSLCRCVCPSQFHLPPCYFWALNKLIACITMTDLHVCLFCLTLTSSNTRMSFMSSTSCTVWPLIVPNKYLMVMVEWVNTSIAPSIRWWPWWQWHHLIGCGHQEKVYSLQQRSHMPPPSSQGLSLPLHRMAFTCSPSWLGSSPS